MAGSAKQKRKDGSRYLAMVGYCIIMLVGAPIAKLTLDGSAQSKAKLVPFSPVQCTALAVQEYALTLRPVVPILLAPSAMFKHAVKTAKDCLLENHVPETCTVQSYLNYGKAQETSHYELKQLKVLLEQAFTSSQLSVLYIGSLVVLLGAVAALIRPVKASILGYPLMAMSIYSAKPAGFLATFAIVFFLAAFAISDIEDLRLLRLRAVKRVRQEAAKKRK